MTATVVVPRAPSVPWRPADARRLMGGLVVGVVAVGVGWYQASGTGRLSTQIEWLDLATAGVTLLGASMLGWLLAARRAVGARRAVLIARLGSYLPSAEAPTPAVTAAAADPDVLPVAVDGLHRYHRPTCVLVAGRATEGAPVAEHLAASREPCRVCVP